MIRTGANNSTGEETVPVPLYPPQIPDGPARDRTLASAVRRRQLTAFKE